MVGRPRDFDETDALEHATDLFWRLGFQSTSMSALLEHMSIGRQSLYNTFGGKKKLFQRVLEHYFETQTTPMLAGMEAPDSDLRSIEKYFAAIARESAAPAPIRKGCLMVNTLVELADRDGEIGRETRRFTARLEKALLNALQGAKRAGQLNPNLHLQDAAKFLATTAHGMLVVCKVGASWKQQRATAQLALDTIRA